MDPLTMKGIAANVDQVLSCGAEITRRLKDCFDRSDDAPESVRELLYILPAFVEVIKQAQQVGQASDTSTEKRRAILLMVEECKDQVSKLHGIIQNCVPNSRDGSRAKIRRAIQGSIVSDSKVDKITQRLCHYLTTFSALGTADVTSVVARLLENELNQLPELRQQRTIEIAHALLQQQNRAPIRQILQPEYLEIKSAFDNIPRMMRATEFVRRDAIHKGIILGFDVQNHRTLRAVVLSGMLGSGKTQAAIDWTNCMAQREFHSIFWVDASSDHDIDASFKEISQKLTEPPQNFASYREHQDYVVKRLKSWEDNWLMVVNNCNTPDAVKRLDLGSFIPHRCQGYILVTSQLPAASLEDLSRKQAILPLHMVVEIEGLEDDQALQVLDAWAKGMQWTGNGKRFDALYATLDGKFQNQLKQCRFLGVGGHGQVNKVLYRAVMMARKSFMIPADIEEHRLEELKKEAKLGLKLEGHHHIIKTVGTYLEGEDWFHMLLYPVAACDLDRFLADFTHLQSVNQEQQIKRATSQRFQALGFGTGPFVAVNRFSQRLLEIMGCITQGMVWMHGKDIRHRDLKPANVLLRRGEVLLTDFGISEERTNAQKTTTELDVGCTRGYAAPEVWKKKEYNSKEADIYSLGCVFLHILSEIYGPNKPLSEGREEMITSYGSSPNFRREYQFRDHQLRTGSSDHPSIPPHLIDLLLPMFAHDRKSRPTIEAVDESLRELGGEGQNFHGRCCRNENSAFQNFKQDTPVDALDIRCGNDNVDEITGDMGRVELAGS